MSEFVLTLVWTCSECGWTCVVDQAQAQDGGGGRDQRSRTPPAFRDVLLAMARTAAKVPA